MRVTRECPYLVELLWRFLCFCDLDLDSEIWTRLRYAKNEVSRSSFQKFEHEQQRQTQRHTDTTERIISRTGRC